MIRIVAQGVARFVEHPLDTLAGMRPATPPLNAALIALVAATLCMVVIDLVYGPLAFPESLEPGGKRSIHAFSIAAVEIIRIFGVAAMLWLGLRMFLGVHVRLTEALWLTVPYALALVGLELLQAGTWVLLLATGLNVYGPMFAIGFGGTLLVLTVSVRALAPERDWLACLPIAAIAFLFGTFVPNVALIGVAVVLVLDRLGARR